MQCNELWFVPCFMIKSLFALFFDLGYKRVMKSKLKPAVFTDSPPQSVLCLFFCFCYFYLQFLNPYTSLQARRNKLAMRHCCPDADYHISSCFYDLIAFPGDPSDSGV